MAHFFYDNGKGTTPVNFVKVSLGKTVQVGVWSANINGTFLTPGTNNPATASVASKGTNTADNMIRGIVIKGEREGNVMLEARLGAGGPVWAFTQVVVGPKAAAASAVGAQAVTVAQKELQSGVFEENDNDNTGSRIDEYEHLFGMHGLPWCAMFVYWCFNSASLTMGTPNPLPKIAAAQALLVWAQRNNKLVTDPTAGDVLIVKPGTHVGLVVGPVNAAGKVPTIEGNTWAHGTAENHKDGVYASSRVADRCFFLRV